MSEIECTLESAHATEALGARLAAIVEGAAVVYLVGELGAGKTTLVRGFLRALGYDGAVRSPTYTLVEPYAVGGRQVFHLDLYRLGDPGELEFIGLRDLLDGSSVVLVEWPERGRGVLPAADLAIELRYAGTARRCRVIGHSAAGQAFVVRLASESHA